MVIKPWNPKPGTLNPYVRPKLTLASESSNHKSGLCSFALTERVLLKPGLTGRRTDPKYLHTFPNHNSKSYYRNLAFYDFEYIGPLG